MANGACAIANMLNAAWSLQIDGCWINALRTIQEESLIREMLKQFEILENHMVVGMVVLGYMKEDMRQKTLWENKSRAFHRIKKWIKE